MDDAGGRGDRRRPGPDRANGHVVASEYALLAHWTTPWVWAVRPPHDRGAAICAALVFTAGLAVAAARGARDQE